jgi:hypothetical protein
MVNISYHLNENGMKFSGRICDHVAQLMMEALEMEKVGLKLSSWTCEHPIWGGIDPDSIFFHNHLLCSQYQEFMKHPHMELGGINGQNAFSIRKITDWVVDCAEGVTNPVIDRLDAQISDYLKENDYNQEAIVEQDEATALANSVSEQVQNSLNAGATKISINFRDGSE